MKNLSLKIRLLFMYSIFHSDYMTSAVEAFNFLLHFRITQLPVVSFSKNFRKYRYAKLRLSELYRSIGLILYYALPIWIGVFLFAFGISHAENILAIFSLPGASSFTFHKEIVNSLHEAGHRITFLTTYPLKVETSQNFTVVDVSGGLPNLIGGFSPTEFASYTVHDRMHSIFTHEEMHCPEIMKLQIIKDALSSEIKFDVMMTQLLFVPQCQLKLAEILKIPVIGTIPFKQEMPMLNTGNPLNPSVLPHVLSLSASGSRMSFMQRLVNTWYYAVSRFFEASTIQPAVIKFCRHYFPEFPTPPKISPALIFVNSHSSLLPRPLVPNFIEVAGIHIVRPNPLKSTLQKFIDEAEHGVILFTLGSMISSSKLPPKIVSAFVEAFASIPQRVIWKYDEPLKDAISDNILLVDWVPQRDILEHENVIAFISHCGLSGMLEAIHTSTPVIAVPLFADQLLNAQFLVESQVAVHLPILKATKIQILDAANAIINDTRYYENMEKLSRRFKDRPLTPQQSVVYWTEYVIRHKGAAHMRTAAADTPLYQYLLLDVIAFVGSLIAFLFYVIYFIIIKVTRRLRSVPSTETNEKYKKMK